MAARGFESAARIAEPVDLNSAWWHWIDAAAAHARSAEIFPDITASRAAVQVIRRHSLPLAIATNNKIKLQRARYELAEDLLALSARVSEDEAVTLRAEALVEARLALAALSVDAKTGLRVTGLTQVGQIELAIARSLSGSAGLVANRAAVLAFRQALALAPADGTCMTHLGTAVRALADHVPEPEASAALDEAISLYRAALHQLPSEGSPADRASLSSLLGAAYLASADRGGANIESDLLQTAKSLFENAAASLVPTLRPLSWAQAVGNIAIVERRLAAGPDREAMLRAVISRYQALLTVYSRRETAQEWAQTKNNLGAALMNLAILLDDFAALQLLRDAIAAFEDALTEQPVFTGSRRYTRVRNNLGLVYRHLGARLDGVDGVQALRTSVAALETVVASRSLKSEPLDWAGSCSNLAMSEAALADRLGDIALMDKLHSGNPSKNLSSKVSY